MAGQRIQMTGPDGGVTRYAYDLAHRLTSLTDPQNLVTSYTYDNADRLTQAILGNGVKVLYSYDNANRLLMVENRKSDNTLILSFAYLLDALGNRTRMTEANGDYTDSGYDNVYQLLSEVKKNAGGTTLYSDVYTDDNVGNRLTMTKDGVQTSYTYDANNFWVDEKNIRNVVRFYKLPEKMLCSTLIFIEWFNHGRLSDELFIPILPCFVGILYV